ncbi:MAG: hypothetical protein LBU90_07270 [Bacteroidales bacterium]|jgi:hypothetical protein|nr:hypothetical protein [Bacteroidales bacterium]
MLQAQKIRLLPNEVFKQISLGEDDQKLKNSYAISNRGRLVSYTETPETGRIIKGGLQDGYRVWRYKISAGNDSKKVYNRCRFLYKLVAEYFVPQPSPEHTYLLHINYVRANDWVENLRWATYNEMIAHRYYSPRVIEARKDYMPKLREARGGSKLTETEVMRLKKKLLDPNRKTRLKMLAKQFGVTEMQLHRIKTGENWGHITV